MAVPATSTPSPDIHKSLVKVPEEAKKCLIHDPDNPTEPYMGFLPPIDMIEIPRGETKTLTIRWLHQVGYSVKEIHHFLGIKYQMVRNIVTTVPKRAAREDLPPLVVHYKPEKDIIDDAMDGALDASLMEGRKERLKAMKDAAKDIADSGVNQDAEED